MLINASAAEEVRMALVEDGVLTDLDVETASREKTKGNIYKGIVANVEASLGAAFIEFGHAKQGFLAFDDLRPELWDPSWQGEGRPRITDVLHRKQEIIVQVTKEEMGSKGAAVTSYLSLPGRYVVLMHSGGGRGGVSRKIEDERERAKAKEVLDKLKLPEGLGTIIRTAGTGKNRAELQKDLNNLMRQWNKIHETAQIARAPSLLYREPDLVVRTIRDYLTPDVDEVIIDDRDEYEEALDYFKQGETEVEKPAAPPEGEAPAEGAPPPPPPPPHDEEDDLIRLYQGRLPLFEKFDVEEQIEALYKRTVPLPSGGYLVIDQTEALVSIDVNSGKSTREDDHESTVYKTNLEAVTEAARQLRLRDMGGIIVVDLIDMASRKHERDVENRFKEVIKSDKARIKFSRISDNGLLELTRQRLRQAHRLVSHVPCQACSGTGVVRAVPGQAVAALRELQRRAAAGQGLLARLAARLPLDAANHLANHKRLELDALAKQYDLKVEVLADPTLATGDSKFDEEKRGRAAMQAPALPMVKEEEWRTRRRPRREERRDERPAAEAPVSIEDRQEASFEADRGRQGRHHRDRGGDRGAERGRHERGRRGGGEARAAPAPLGPDGRALVAEDIRGAPPPRPHAAQNEGPRNYPDDALMQVLFGDPPPLALEAAPPAPPPGAVAPPPLPPDAVEPGMEGAPPPVAAAPGEGATPAVPAAPGMDGGLPGKKRRRRRRRRRKGGAVMIDPLTGQPIPQPLQAAGGAPGTAAEGAEDDEGEEGDEEEVEEHDVLEARALSHPPAPQPTPGVAADLVAAATQAILSAPPPYEAPTTRELPRPSEVLDAAEVRAHLDAEAASNGEDEDDEDEEADELPPMPPPGPPAPDAVARSDEPTVAAKRNARKPRTGKPRAAAGAKKKAAPRKKARPRSE